METDRGIKIKPKGRGYDYGNGRLWHQDPRSKGGPIRLQVFKEWQGYYRCDGPFRFIPTANRSRIGLLPDGSFGVK